MRKLKEIYLKKDNNSVLVFYSQNEMLDAGYNIADKIITEEAFNGNGCYTRIIDGEIVVGRTEAEIAAGEIGEKIAEIKSRFEEIDKLDGPRPIREAVAQLANSAGLDTSYLMRHEPEASQLRQQLAELELSA
ncbi:MAG: hypothetical protein LBB81_01275 [Treponema sp.]|jgi:hypothetical protein|nr:hypothetical protein [Treponema sp.]